MIPQRITRAVTQHYTFNRLAAELSFRFAPIYKTNPLIIYQMGKVGSETLERSLSACRIGRPIYRAHSLVEEHIQRGLNQVNMTARDYFKRSRHVFHGQRLAREIARDLHRGQWQVVSMVRDPVAQNISSFFQILDLLVPDFESRLRAGTLETSVLMERFLENYPPDSTFINWFDVEMKRTFEIDVFQSEFDVEAGYQIYREPHVELLVLRLEDLDRSSPKAFQEFLGLEDFRVIRTNEASRKEYFALYRRFREEAVFPAEYIDQVYQSKYARTFYTAEEIRRFRERLNVAP